MFGRGGLKLKYGDVDCGEELDFGVAANIGIEKLQK